jgi:hypothetical protein
MLTPNFPRPMGVVPPVSDSSDDAPNAFSHLLERYRAADRPGFTDLPCDGMEDEHGNPICDGDDVRAVWFLNNVDAASILVGEPDWKIAHWCISCRQIAEADGYRVVLLGGPDL